MHKIVRGEKSVSDLYNLIIMWQKLDPIQDWLLRNSLGDDVKEWQRTDWFQRLEKQRYNVQCEEKRGWAIIAFGKILNTEKKCGGIAFKERCKEGEKK